MFCIRIGVILRLQPRSIGGVCQTREGQRHKAEWQRRFSSAESLHAVLAGIRNKACKTITQQELPAIRFCLCQ